MKDLKDCTIREIEKIKEDAAEDFRSLIKKFFKDHPHVRNIVIAQGNVFAGYRSNFVHKNDGDANITAYLIYDY